MRTNYEILPPDPLILLGCGGHAKSVAAVYLSCYPKASLLFVDNMAMPNEKILGFPALSNYPQNITHCFLAIGDNKKRKLFWEEFSKLQKLDPIIAPSALIAPHAQIGRNVFIGNLAHIGPEAKIGHNTIINTGSIIEHEVMIGDHSHVAPRAVISGRSTIGSLTFIGVGAIVKDSVHIGSNIIIGAGAVVVENLSKPGTYIGCPAKRLSINAGPNPSY